MIISDGQWAETRDALRRAGDRFADLLAAVPDPAARATRSWSAAQTAAHMVSLAWACETIVEPGSDSGRDARLDGQLRDTQVDTVRDLNDLLLRQYIVERDLAPLAARLREHVRSILRATDGRDPTEAVDWLGGSRLPLGGLLAHLTNELLIHGWDIARAGSLRWEIPPRDAGLFIELFLVGVTSYGYGALLDSTAPPPRRRIAVQFRSRHTLPVTIVLDGTGGHDGNRGRVSITQPGPGDDVRLSFDPPTLNLVLFGRMSRLRAALTGRLFVSGPRPWLLPAFLRTVHMPDN
ncbi:maleylpyruvate isomerase N-terminal domain-containing protein [Plantactinospora veratri]|uniref:Maleylpyruvate isomerase N-terminal domain-containing protein n=1 Tax=Plantactinospora veratri TaxID=1436122 RepID=A0ABU7SAP7_9ACTN